MGTYLMMMYVSLEQELAVKDLFTNKGWGFKKPDLRITTEDIGPLMEETVQTEIIAQAPCQEMVQTQTVVQMPHQVTAQTQPDDIVQTAYQEMPIIETFSQVPSQQEQQAQRVEKGKRPKRTPKRNPKYEQSAVDPKSAQKVSKVVHVEKYHPKVKVDIDKQTKDAQESSEFQEILQEAEMITASLNDIEKENNAEHVNENQNDNAASHNKVKTEQYSDDIADFDSQVNGNTAENTGKLDLVPSSSKFELEEASVGTSASGTSSSKKRKLTGKIAANQGETKMEVMPREEGALLEVSVISGQEEDVVREISDEMIMLKETANSDELMPVTPVRLGGTSIHQESCDVPYSNTPHHTSLLRSTMTSEKKTCTIPIRKYSCNACCYKSNVKSNMMRHEKTQHGSVSFVCQVCNKAFRSAYYLKLHLQSHVNPNVCEFCGKRFSSKTGLKYHINKVHLSTANYECPLCNKSYQAKSNYEGHVNAHKGYKPFICPTCNKCFSYKSSLNFHMKHCSHAACYACTSCNAKFGTKTLLAQHTLGKHVRQVFACSCGKTFKWKTSLLKHQNLCDCK